MSAIDYACEHNDVPCREYRVTSHDGTVSRCVYCDDCAALAEIDWNGETAKIEPAPMPIRKTRPTSNGEPREDER